MASKFRELGGQGQRKTGGGPAGSCEEGQGLQRGSGDGCVVSDLTSETCRGPVLPLEMRAVTHLFHGAVGRLG